MLSRCCALSASVKREKWENERERGVKREECERVKFLRFFFLEAALFFSFSVEPVNTPYYPIHLDNISQKSIPVTFGISKRKKKSI